MKKKIISYIITLVILIVGFAGSGMETAAKGGQASLTFSTKKATVVAGKKFQYKVTYTKADGTANVIPGKKVSWSTSDSKVATISKNGTLKAKTVGKVKVVAEYRGIKTTYKVTIKGKKIIGIDAGHQQKGNSSQEAVGPGASTTKAKVSSGTTGVSSKVPEYKVTLAIALQLRDELISRGYEVVMTRTKNDVDISNKERALLLNESCDIGIRLHCDGSSNSSVTGATALFTSTKNKYVKASVSKKSKLLGEAMMTQYCAATGIKNRGTSLRDDLTGNNWSTIPTIVLEMGFMSNGSEDQWMQKASNQSKMVKGIADGIDAYYEEN